MWLWIYYKWLRTDETVINNKITLYVCDMMTFANKKRPYNKYYRHTLQKGQSVGQWVAYKATNIIICIIYISDVRLYKYVSGRIIYIFKSIIMFNWNQFQLWK